MYTICSCRKLEIADKRQQLSLCLYFKIKLTLIMTKHVAITKENIAEIPLWDRLYLVSYM